MERVRQEEVKGYSTIMKKSWRVIGAFVASTTMLVGLSGCSLKDVRSYFDHQQTSIQKNGDGSSDLPDNPNFRNDPKNQHKDQGTGSKPFGDA